MIKVKNLTKYYGEVMAVDDVSFEIQKGEIVGLLGPNGAGKTTTMRIMTGFLSPTKGDVEICSYSVLKNPIEVKRRVGYLPENNPLYEDMDVWEYLEMVADFREIPEKSKRIKSVVEQCRLSDVLSLNIGQLSRGYRQRVGFAAAIIHDPEVLVLDEPTSGLDPNQTREVRELIKKFKKEKTILISTHILSEVQMSCDRAIIINKGKIIASGTTEELTNMVSSESTVTIEIKANQEEFERKIRENRNIKNYKLINKNGALKYEIYPYANYDIREELFKIAVENNWTLLELHQSKISLEEVFHKLTQESV